MTKHPVDKHPVDRAPVDSVAAVGLDRVLQDADPLAGALHHLRMDGVFYCRSELTSPWGLDLPAMAECMWFHVVTRGTCWLTVGEQAGVQVEAGDVVVLPHGSAHTAVDAPGSHTPLVFDLPHEYVTRQYAVLRHGGPGAGPGALGANIICGVVQFGHPAARSLIELLPEIIHIETASTSDDAQQLSALLDLMAVEAASTRPGGETIVTRLSDVLVIQAIRSWIESDPGAERGWLGALRDPVIGAALARIHAEPALDWTVTSLASEVGMSRSGFSARFTELVGVSPKHYVTTWRMRLAEDRLRRESVSILTLATELGYQSEAAFSRAFKREVGVAPSHVRRDE